MVRAFLWLAACLALVPLRTRAENVTYREREAPRRISTQNVALMADIGVSRYDRSLGPATEAGVAYGAHVELTAHRQVSVDLIYQGALNELSPQYSTNGQLLTNQFSGDVRINFVPPNYDFPARMRPFIFGGIGYQRITAQNFTPGISDTNAIVFPVGAGLEADVGSRFVVGARYAYNFLTNEASHFPGGDADNWVASVNLGARVWP